MSMVKKVKIFQARDIKKLEDDINQWLKLKDGQNIKITQALQSESSISSPRKAWLKPNRTVTLFYEEEEVVPLSDEELKKEEREARRILLEGLREK